MFSIVHKDESAGSCIYGLRFVDTFMHEEQLNAFKKYQLVAQAFSYKAYGMLTNASTVRCASMPLLLTLFTVDNDLRLITHTVFQAYV